MRLLFASVLLAYPVSALAIEVTAAPNATMNDNAALTSKIDVTAAVAQAAYNALSTQVSTLSTNLTNLQNSYNSMLSCSSSLKFFNGSSCLNPPTGGPSGPSGPDPNLTALLACQAQYKFYNGSTCVHHPIVTRLWQSYASSARNKDIVYQNTLAYPIEVSAATNGNRKCSAEFEVADAAGGPFVRVFRSNVDMASAISGQSAGCPVYGTVAPGKYYRMTSTYGSSFGSWAEMR